MEKKWLTAIILTCAMISASSQTLFTYGTYKADAKDFLRAFNKNNQQAAVNKRGAIKEYLELYINSRLKIREAYDKGYDTLQHIKSEIENLRNQVIENYMSDPEAINRLTKEAFQRSLKDIRAAHIFISFANTGGITDTVAARQKLDIVLNRLAKKEDFLAVAQQLSDDPSAKTNKGELNYITVFTLPYEFENIIYATAAGKYSKPYTSKAGYHIFKNLGERKALGKVKVQQILLAFPPGINEAGKKATARLADSLYQRIKAGDDFAKLAASFSNDYVSAASEGNIPDIAVGQYDPSFEKTIWSLKDGTVSKPFVTTHGYHIVKKIASKTVITNAGDKTNTDELQQKVKADNRWKTAKDFIYARVIEKAGFQRSSYSDAALWALSDSLLDRKPAGIGKSMNEQSPLFKVGDTTIPVSAWITYGQMNRYKADRTSLKTYPDLMDEFKKQVFYQYYRDHLENFNDDFRNQMDEFRDGNLFFEIMQQEVWNKAQVDSAALLSLYEKNKSQYNWKQSADAVIFFCTDEATAKTLSDQLRKNPAAWKTTVEAVNEKVVADSARYEWSQIPGLGQAQPKAGSVTSITVNTADKTASFALIHKVYLHPGSRSFNEAKGLVMNDYQTLLEEEWIKALKKKYPVKVDEKVLSGISE
ncbi:MAG: peptidylprolyl isomerase [Chitinophagaceae bacterium]